METKVFYRCLLAHEIQYFSIWLPLSPEGLPYHLLFYVDTAKNWTIYTDAFVYLKWLYFPAKCCQQADKLGSCYRVKLPYLLGRLQRASHTSSVCVIPKVYQRLRCCLLCLRLMRTRLLLFAFPLGLGSWQRLSVLSTDTNSLWHWASRVNFSVWLSIKCIQWQLITSHAFC